MWVKTLVSNDLSLILGTYVKAGESGLHQVSLCPPHNMCVPHHVHKHTYTHTCTRPSTHTHTHKNICIHPSTYTHTHTSIHIHTHTCTHTYAHTHKHICTHPYTYIQNTHTYIYISTHIHTYSKLRGLIPVLIAHLRAFAATACQGGLCPPLLLAL